MRIIEELSTYTSLSDPVPVHSTIKSLHQFSIGMLSWIQSTSHVSVLSWIARAAVPPTSPTMAKVNKVVNFILAMLK